VVNALRPPCQDSLSPTCHNTRLTLKKRPAASRHLLRPIRQLSGEIQAVRFKQVLAALRRVFPSRGIPMFLVDPGLSVLLKLSVETDARGLERRTVKE
jgi:hypothetical protein